jgi:hypothetical protein
MSHSLYESAVYFGLAITNLSDIDAFIGGALKAADIICDAGKCVVICPGDSPSKVLHFLSKEEVTPQASYLQFPISNCCECDDETITEAAQQLITEHATEEQLALIKQGSFVFMDYTIRGHTMSGVIQAAVNIAAEVGKNVDDIRHVALSEHRKMLNAMITKKFSFNTPPPTHPSTKFVINLGLLFDGKAIRSVIDSEDDNTRFMQYNDIAYPGSDKTPVSNLNKTRFKMQMDLISTRFKKIDLGKTDMPLVTVVPNTVYKLVYGHKDEPNLVHACVFVSIVYSDGSGVRVQTNGSLRTIQPRSIVSAKVVRAVNCYVNSGDDHKEFRVVWMDDGKERECVTNIYIDTYNALVELDYSKYTKDWKKVYSEQNRINMIDIISIEPLPCEFKSDDFKVGFYVNLTMRNGKNIGGFVSCCSWMEMDVVADDRCYNVPYFGIVKAQKFSRSFYTEVKSQLAEACRKHTYRIQYDTMKGSRVIESCLMYCNSSSFDTVVRITDGDTMFAIDYCQLVTVVVTDIHTCDNNCKAHRYSSAISKYGPISME